MKIVVIAILLILAGCTNSNDAERALSGAGYKNIQTGGYAWFDCSKDDFYHTEFTATNPSGQTVTGVVCSGLIFKSATIRF